MLSKAYPALTPVFWIGAGAGALYAWFAGNGFPQYDTEYALVWGRELAHGASPDYSAPIPPTPHPLADLVGAIASPFGAGAMQGMAVALAFISLGAVAYLVYRLGQLWFGPAVGLIAALIAITRYPLLNFGVQAYVDIPFVALVLTALVVEAKRARAGWPVLALLAAAGLLRPEAWLFSLVYLAYLALEPDPPRGRLALRRRQDRGRRELAGLALLAVSAPLAWAAFDLITSGDALHSFSGTRDTVGALGRQTGLVDLVRYGPRRLGEILQVSGLLAGFGGAALCLAFLRDRSRLATAAAVAALLAFGILALAGLAIITRYLLLAAMILAVFGGAAVLGWRLLPRAHAWRRRWAAFGALCIVVFCAFGPFEWNRLDDLRGKISLQTRIRDDLHRLAEDGDFRPGCAPISVPNHRAVPSLALWLDLDPSRIVSSSEQGQPRHGYFLAPADAEVRRTYVLDPNDPRRLITAVPPGFRLVAHDRSWDLYANCARLRGRNPSS